MATRIECSSPMPPVGASLRSFRGRVKGVRFGLFKPEFEG